jgi:hypothetical protein
MSNGIPSYFLLSVELYLLVESPMTVSVSLYR